MTDTTSLYTDYDAWKGWSEPFRWSPEEGRYFAAELGRDPKGLDILEMGFGNGAFLGWARDKGARVLGSELTPRAIEAARAAGIALVPSDFEVAGGLPPLDAVVAFDVFEHLDPDSISAKLAAIAAALRPGGVLVMRYPNGQSPFGLDPQHADRTHLIALSRAKIEQYAAGTGLVTLRYGATARVSSGSIPRDLLRSVRYILRGLHARFIRFVYATDVELAPVVTQVMTRQTSPGKLS
jgi:SAM-dependent methyltransferase